MRILPLIVALALLVPGAAAAEQRVIVSFSGDLPAAADRAIDVAHRYDAVDAVAGTMPAAAADRLDARPGVTVEEDVKVRALGELSWNLAGRYGVDAPAAWDLATGEGATVAVLDTGVDTDHPELADDIADCESFVAYTASCEDDHGHGTHVAGIVTAARDGTGVAGVAPGAEIDAVKVIGANGVGWWSDIIAAIDDTVREGDAAVVSMSFGSHGAPDAAVRALEDADDAGIVLVAASGNTGGSSALFPARHPDVVAVGAVGRGGGVPWFSSGGADILAPGVGIPSTLPWGTGRLSGTSAAAPHVAGTAAMMRSLNPRSPVRPLLAATGRDVGAAAPLIDAGGAVRCAGVGRACLASAGRAASAR